MIFSFYFELSKNSWYFFNYRNNILMALSSDAYSMMLWKRVLSHLQRRKDWLSW